MPVILKSFLVSLVFVGLAAIQNSLSQHYDWIGGGYNLWHAFVVSICSQPWTIAQVTRYLPEASANER